MIFSADNFLMVDALHFLFRLDHFHIEPNSDRGCEKGLNNCRVEQK